MKYYKYLLILFLLVSQNSIAQTSHSGCAPKTSDRSWYDSGKKAPLFKGLEGVDFKISTSSQEAQAYFNQGLMLSYAFNHAEAARSFYQAIRLDSSCAMCYWGYALVLGPNYNAGMEKDNIPRAYAAVQEALNRSESATQKERMLILALAQRYDSVQTDDRSWYDEAYAFSMKSVYLAFPDDPDIGALYAEALMDQHPWDLHHKDGSPKEWTPEIINTLEEVLRKHPRHPGANHFYIHAVEASDNPGRATASADLLRDLVPGAGHLVHMPSHIYIRTGRYHEGSLANLNAVKVDSNYVTACHAQGVYPLAYYPHNYHFLAATATLEGKKNLSVMACNKMRDLLDANLMLQPEWGTLQHYYSILYFVMVKFGMWNEIAKLPDPAKELLYPRGVLEYARGMASLAKEDLAAASKHLDNLKRIAADSAISGITIWDLNSASDIMNIAVNVLEGEYLFISGQTEAGLEKVVAAMEIEDRLNYNEPPDWFFSVRHNLGAMLIAANIPHLAEKYFKEDLKTYPLNGWALAGLKKALQMQGNIEELKTVETQFKEAWKHSDTQISSSRILN
ncbi:MAG: hypothetical protein DWQ44_01940 [Bacteroidetes bacterium]|nr:MAG: hypothetical protein DWQ33_05670 [Bacteroidota bacterium]REK05319.1 MAG: hypothetical protein DWQ39_05835 [Bacteroidota bacterium]REK36387.1 MAG: hypothetical protein DWQ44_01940 [Bacteroidota bacterium]REK51519.1 MAG: hypothetical protein DWQ48_00895 [Bacteroidota bacterium]